MTLWRLRTTLYVPTLIPVALGGGAPQTLEFVSRVPEQTRDYSSYRVALTISESTPQDAINPQVKAVDLVTEVVADDAIAAMDDFSTTLEAILDLMSFEMGASIGVGQTDVVDVSPPVLPGESRQWATHAPGAFDKNARSVEMEAIRGSQFGYLPDISVVQSSRVAAAVRWFAKALSTDLIHDQFIFLWIALEILSDDSDISIESSYKAKCGHEVAKCPECEKSTARKVLGPSRKAFLEAFGATAPQSKLLWEMRQLMHGAISFDSKKLEKLPALLQVLRAAVAAGVKARLGIPAGSPPIIAASGLAMSPAINLTGSREITDTDIKAL